MQDVPPSDLFESLGGQSSSSVFVPSLITSCYLVKDHFSLLYANPSEIRLDICPQFFGTISSEGASIQDPFRKGDQGSWGLSALFNTFTNPDMNTLSLP
jgi:hypothetical protein